MPEQIRFTGINSEAEHFMVEALGQARRRKIEVPFTQGEPIEMTLTMNGVEIPFADTIKVIYYMMEARLDIRAAKMAYEKFSGNEIFEMVEKLRDTLRQADWQAREAVEKAFGVSLPED